MIPRTLTTKRPSAVPVGTERLLDHAWSTTATRAAKADSTGRRSTLIVEVFVGRRAGWIQGLTGRAPMRSPGKPSLRRDVERRFWCDIGKGLTSEEAALAVGVSLAAGSRSSSGIPSQVL